jgi:prevent-host-death family protein
MGKMIGAAEFKAHALRLLKEVQQGATVTITNRGRPVAKLVPIVAERQAPRPFVGCMKGSAIMKGDIVGPIDPDWETEWEANNPPELYRSKPDR